MAIALLGAAFIEEPFPVPLGAPTSCKRPSPLCSERNDPECLVPTLNGSKEED
jgi:hypothetical protein